MMRLLSSPLTSRPKAQQPQWLSVRNASEPQIVIPNLGQQSDPSRALSSLAGAIYGAYQYCTTLNSAFACWGVIAGMNLIVFRKSRKNFFPRRQSALGSGPVHWPGTSALTSWMPHPFGFRRVGPLQLKICPGTPPARRKEVNGAERQLCWPCFALAFD